MIYHEQKNLGYGVFLFMLALVLKIFYPINLVYTSIQDPSVGILVAFMIWIEGGRTFEKENPVQLLSKFELYLCAIIGIITFSLPFYVSIEKLGLEAALIDIPLLIFGVLVFIILVWFFGSLVPRILYRYGILQHQEKESQKPDEPLGKLFD